MNSKPVEALPEVVADVLDAAVHYQSWRSDGKQHIIRKYDETISWIAWNPDLFPRAVGRVQRAILKNSYYVVYFVQEMDRSLVLAVLDGRRSPMMIKKIVRRRRLKS